MKALNIISLTCLAAGLLSCTGTEPDSPGTPGNGMLGIKPQLSDMEVVSKAGIGHTVYAYTAEDLAEGTLFPYSPSLTQGDIIYYKIPQESQGAVFTNIGGSENEAILFTAGTEGTLTFSTKDQSAYLSKDILLGSVSGITVGSETPYAISLRRLSSQISSRLIFTDSEGDQIDDSNLMDVTVVYNGFSTSLTVNPDQSVTISGNAGFGTGLGKEETGTWTSGAIDIIPGSDVNTCTVSLSFADGSSQTFETSLDRVLDFNRLYTVTFRITKANGSATFTLEEPDVTERGFGYNSINKSEIFNIRKYNYVGAEAGSTTSIGINLNLPYEWDAALTSGTEWFSVEKSAADSLKVTALLANENETRVGTVRITASNGASTELYVSQSNLSKQVISFINPNGGDIYLDITGKNVEIDCGNGFTAFGDCSGEFWAGLEMEQNTTVTVMADAITEFGCSNNIFSGFSFSNCTSLLSLRLRTSDSPDVSALPALKSLRIENSSCGDIVFAAGQGVENVEVYNCDQLPAIDLSDIAGSVRDLYIGYCDGLSTLTIYPADYAGEKKLETVTLDYNNNLTGVSFYQYTALKAIKLLSAYNIGSLNLNGCTSLESLNIEYGNSLTYLNLTGCSALKDIRLHETRNLGTVMTEGADAVETLVLGSGVNISGTLDLGGRTSLRQIILETSITCQGLNLSGCQNLEITGGHTIYTRTCDISDCPQLTSINLDFSGYDGASFNAAGSGLESLSITNKNFDFDFSTLPALEKLVLHESVETDVDVSGCPVLKEVDIQAQFKSVALPQSIEDIYLYSYGNGFSGTFDLTQYQNMKRLELDSFGNIDSVKVASCQALEYLEVRNCNRTLKGIDARGCGSLEECRFISDNALETVYLDNCNALKYFNKDESSPYLEMLGTVTFTGCSALEVFNVRSSAFTGIDFSPCASLNEVDIRYNDMDAAALDAMFNTLPDRNALGSIGNLRISGNPGEGDCDKNIALGKYWQFNN